jgi:hypothetical protein
MRMVQRNRAASLLAALPVLMLLASPSPAAAMDGEAAADDVRWLAWYGCWTAQDGFDGDEPLFVCFEPLAGEDGVQIHTYVGSEVAGVEFIRADGSPDAVAEGGCAGDRIATFSEDGARVFIRSQMECGEGVTRSTSGVMAMLPDGPRWIEIHGVASGGQEPVLGVQTFVPASRSSLAAHGIEAPALDRALAIQTARASLAQPLDAHAVAELVDEAGSGVARALIAEAGSPFQLDTRTVRDLLDRGVPSDVIDVMVAVTYPDRFEVAGASREAVQMPSMTTRTGAQRTTTPAWGMRPGPSSIGIYSSMGYPYYYSTRSAWGYDPFWGGVWRAPRFVIVQPAVYDRRGRVNPATGYQPNRPTNRTATTRSGNTSSGSAATTRTVPNRVGEAGRSSGATQGATRSGQTGQSGSSTGRTATRGGGG